MTTVGSHIEEVSAQGSHVEEVISPAARPAVEAVPAQPGRSDGSSASAWPQPPLPPPPFHRHRLRHRRRRLRHGHRLRRRHLPRPEAHHCRPLTTTSRPRWCRLLHDHRRPGGRLHRCHHRQSSSCTSKSWRRSSPIHLNAPPACALTMPLLDPRVRRLYMCYVDRREQHLLLSVDWVVAVRPVEDAAGGCGDLLCACCCTRSCTRLTEP